MCLNKKVALPSNSEEWAPSAGPEREFSGVWNLKAFECSEIDVLKPDLNTLLFPNRVWHSKHGVY